MGLDIRYLAGFFDGEGCIQYTRRTKGSKVYTYIRVTATNTYFPIIREIHRQFGGRTFTQTKKPKKCWKPTMDWIMNGKEAAAMLTLMLPYLRVKRKAALRALRYHKKTRVRP